MEGFLQGCFPKEASLRDSIKEASVRESLQEDSRKEASLRDSLKEAAGCWLLVAAPPNTSCKKKIRSCKKCDLSGGSSEKYG